MLLLSVRVVLLVVVSGTYSVLRAGLIFTIEVMLDLCANVGSSGDDWTEVRIRRFSTWAFEQVTHAMKAGRHCKYVICASCPTLSYSRSCLFPFPLSSHLPGSKVSVVSMSSTRFFLFAGGRRITVMMKVRERGSL